MDLSRGTDSVVRHESYVIMIIVTVNVGISLNVIYHNVRWYKACKLTERVKSTLCEAITEVRYDTVK